MSRGAYKGARIEWYPDECAMPLPKVQYVLNRENAPQPQKQANTMMNRFQMLNIDDGTEDGSEEAEEGDISNFVSMHPGANWATPTVAA